MKEEKGIQSESSEVEIVDGEIVEKSDDETLKELQSRSWMPQDADREERKFFTRQRVRNAKIPEGTVFYHARPKPSITDGGEKAVAVYARVSTKNEEQVSSIENQTRYYAEKISKTPNWKMQEIYADM